MQPMERRPSLSTELTRRLETMIMDGDWKPGDRLPGQRQLAEQLGVSMAAIREALSGLAAAGLIEFRHGKGTFVCGIGETSGSVDAWLGPLQGGEEELQEYLEVRRELERFAIRQAAARATSEQRERLTGLVGQMRAFRSDMERYTEADLALHMTLAEAAGNRVLLRVMRALQVSLQRYLLQVNEEHRRRGLLEAALANHERLVAAVVAGDGAAADNELDTIIGRGISYWEQKLHSGVEPR